MAKALRKNTICPTGATSPSWRTSADMAANSSAEISLRPMALNGCMVCPAIRPRLTTMAGKVIASRAHAASDSQKCKKSGKPDFRAQRLTVQNARLFRPGQRLEINRDGFAIGGPQLPRIGHHLHHRAADTVRIR